MGLIRHFVHFPSTLSTFYTDITGIFTDISCFFDCFRFANVLNLLNWEKRHRYAFAYATSNATLRQTLRLSLVVHPLPPLLKKILDPPLVLYSRELDWL